MATLNINGRRVKVDDSFMSLSPEQQNATVDEIAGQIGVQPASKEEKPKGSYRGTILPYEKNLDTGETSWAVPSLLTGIFESGKQAVTAPGRAMDGELQVMGPDGNVSPDAIAEGFNFAAWASPSSPASGLTSKAAPVAQQRVLSEGEQVAQAGQRIGVELPRAVTSDSMPMQQMGKIVSNMPIGGTPLKKASRVAIQQLDDAAMNTQKALGSGDRAIAGAAMREGVTDYSKNVLGGRIAALEDDVAKAMNPDKITALSKTKGIVNDIVTKRKAGALQGEGKAASLVSDAINREGMTFDGIRTLRTSIREMLDNPTLIPSDISQSELKRIYTSLSDDLRAAASNAGGKEGLTLFEKANRSEAMIAREREALQRIFGRNASDEKVADNLISMAGTTSRANVKDLLRARAAVSKETWDDLASSALARMGRDQEGKFSPDRFLTAWGKLNQGGKKILFTSQEAAKALDDIATVSSRFKKLNEFANPSGTGQTVAGGSYFAGVFLDPMTVVSSIVGTNVLARFMAKPQAIKEVSAYAKAYELAARTPSETSARALAIRARSLALLAANDNPSAASQIASSLSSVQKVASQDGGVGGEGAEVNQDRKGNRPRYLLPNEI